MKIQLLLLFSIIMTSCSSFSNFSRNTKIEKDKEGRTIVYNSELNFQSLTFGDFKFALSKKEFNLLNQNSSPEFNNILFYAQTDDVSYEYYILLNHKKVKKNDKFIYHDTIIGKSKFILAISKDAPISDINFIKNKISEVTE